MYADQAGNQKSAAVANGPTSDIQRTISNGSKGPILLKKSVHGTAEASR